MWHSHGFIHEWGNDMAFLGRDMDVMWNSMWAPHGDQVGATWKNKMTFQGLMKESLNGHIFRSEI